MKISEQTYVTIVKKTASH